MKVFLYHMLNDKGIFKAFILLMFFVIFFYMFVISRGNATLRIMTTTFGEGQVTASAILQENVSYSRYLDLDEPISQISIFMATHHRTVYDVLFDLHVWSGEERDFELYAGNFHKSQILDNSWVTFSFSHPVEASVGGYYLELIPRDLPEDHLLVLWLDGYGDMNVRAESRVSSSAWSAMHLLMIIVILLPLLAIIAYQTSRSKETMDKYLWLLPAALILILGYYYAIHSVNVFRIAYEEFAFLSPTYWALGLFLIFIIYLALFAIKKNISVELIFVILSLGFGVVFIVLFPFNSAPDETAHFLSAYRISNYILFTNPDYMRVEDSIFLNHSVHHQVFTSDFLELSRNLFNKSGVSEVLFHGTRPIPDPFYTLLGSGLGLTIGRLLAFNAVTTFFIADLFQLLIYTVLVFLAVKNTPFLKWAFVFVALLPMSLHLATSFSPDGIMNGMAFLYISYILKLRFTEVTKARDYTIAAILAILLSPIRGGLFILFPLLILVVPSEKMKSFNVCFRHYKVLTLGLSVLHFALNSLNNFRNVVNPGVERLTSSGYPMFTTGWVFSNLTESVRMVARTFVFSGGAWLEQVVGSSLAGFTVSINHIFLIYVFLFILILSILSEREIADIRPKDRLVISVMILMYVGATIFAKFVGWTPNNLNLIVGVQGRYFLAILPLVLFLFKSKQVYLNKSIDTLLVSIFSIALFLSTINYFTSIIARHR